MEVRVVVKTNSRVPSITRKENGILMVAVKSPARENKANTESIELLADYFGVSKNFIRISTGSKSQNKIVKVLER
jgi:uncharacterized protein YggU (UPF0235/DUF167 family)